MQVFCEDLLMQGMQVNILHPRKASMISYNVPRVLNITTTVLFQKLMSLISYLQVW